ncbi:unnamed protein product [Lactuca virosa]|uniref:Uncharacterized protein n=1 Tax=Lactuca virosa TaxID=75947 RepID=A0AAU9M587_9ASTR|nr:unnamed protein product [Lactuca virosa]
MKIIIKKPLRPLLKFLLLKESCYCDGVFVFVLVLVIVMGKFAATVGPEPTKTDLVPAYVRLLRDNEVEVRITAAGKVTKFSRILSPELAIQHILPCELSSDSSQHVRSALASVFLINTEKHTMSICFKSQPTAYIWKWKRGMDQFVMQTRDILMDLHSLVDVKVPYGKHFIVCVDVHGQFFYLLNIFALNGLPSDENPYLFNGDFVDQWSFSVELLNTTIEEEDPVVFTGDTLFFEGTVGQMHESLCVTLASLPKPTKFTAI